MVSQVKLQEETQKSFMERKFLILTDSRNRKHCIPHRGRREVPGFALEAEDRSRGQSRSEVVFFPGVSSGKTRQGRVNILGLTVKMVLASWDSRVIFTEEYCLLGYTGHTEDVCFWIGQFAYQRCASG